MRRSASTKSWLRSSSTISFAKSVSPWLRADSALRLSLSPAGHSEPEGLDFGADRAAIAYEQVEHVADRAQVVVLRVAEEGLPGRVDQVGEYFHSIELGVPKSLTHFVVQLADLAVDGVQCRAVEESVRSLDEEFADACAMSVKLPRMASMNR